VSIALYSVRLYWSNGRGGGRWRGRHVEIERCPQPLAMHLVEIDYAPETGTALIREAGQQRREMTMAEQLEVDRWLESAALL
jgi:hypothetical protein